MGTIAPQPPVAAVALPWDDVVADPVAALAAARAECGDTFEVASPDGPFLFVFSPAGVRSFYALPESAASKGVADWRMISRKLPEELFDGRRTMVHDLFDRAGTAAYLAELEAALDVELSLLGSSGTFEVFSFCRRLGHRMGLASWAGRASARGDRFDALVPALDTLDASDSFVRPDLMASVARDGKRDERAALRVAESLLGASVDERLADRSPPDDLFQSIVDRWSDVSGADRRVGVARDVVLTHLGSMSNLFAALGWTIVDLLAHPSMAAGVAGGDAKLAERCALESTRLAQRSIMLRYVLSDVTVETGSVTYAVPAGATVATLLPLTNTSAGPGLGEYDPERWQGRRLRDASSLPAAELVTAFGHGAHTCPAQPFSLSAMARTVLRLFGSYSLTAEFASARPVPEQIGGVARAADPCPVSYRRLD